MKSNRNRSNILSPPVFTSPFYLDLTVYARAQVISRITPFPLFFDFMSLASFPQYVPVIPETKAKDGIQTSAAVRKPISIDASSNCWIVFLA